MGRPRTLNAGTPRAVRENAGAYWQELFRWIEKGEKELPHVEARYDSLNQYLSKAAFPKKVDLKADRIFSSHYEYFSRVAHDLYCYADSLNDFSSGWGRGTAAYVASHGATDDAILRLIDGLRAAAADINPLPHRGPQGDAPDFLDEVWANHGAGRKATLRTTAHAANTLAQAKAATRRIRDSLQKAI